MIEEAYENRLIEHLKTLITNDFKIKLNDPQNTEIRWRNLGWRINIQMNKCLTKHHYVTLLARISLTLSCHLSLLFIAPERSYRLHPVSAQSCCI